MTTPRTNRLLPILCLCICALAIACKDQKAIDETLAVKSVLTDSINTRQDHINNDSTQITSLSKSSTDEYTHSEALEKSTDSLVHDCPFASAYIYRFDKQPIDIFWTYVNAQSDEDRDKLLKGDILLGAYYLIGSNADTVIKVRTLLKSYDDGKKTCIKNIAANDAQVTTLRSDINSHQQKITELRRLVKIQDDKLATLNN